MARERYLPGGRAFETAAFPCGRLTTGRFAANIDVVRTEEIARFLGAVNDREDELVERIVDWSNVNSGSRNPPGVARMAARLCAALAELTPEVSLVELPPESELRDDGGTENHEVGPAVRACCRPRAPVQILLNGHLDTVFGSTHPFQTARRSGPRLFGPGVADMKGGLLVMVESLRILESAPFRDRVGWEVILNPDEEVGSSCSSGMLADAARRHQIGLVFEPALPDGSLVSGRLGIGNYLVRVMGRTAHAGREFSRGRNAIVALARLIGGFHRLNEETGILVNVGRVRGGGEAVNIVPDQAACRLNIRVETEELARFAERRIREMAGELDGRDGLRAEVHGRWTRPPKPVTPELEALLEEFRACAREDGYELNWMPTGGGSDGNLLAAAGLPVVDSLGVRGGGIHTEGEFLEVESVVERIRLCGRFLLKVAAGEVGVGKSVSFDG